MTDKRTTEVDERVLKTATRLFAELGYDATELSMITDAAGPDAAGSHLLREGKPGLYRAVFSYFHDLEEAYFATVAENAPANVDGVHRLVDAALDFTLTYPEVNALWGHRALKDAIDIEFPEGFAPAMETVLKSRSWAGMREDVDVQYLAWTVIWQVMGFANSGIPDGDPDSAIAAFRFQLHQLIDSRIRAPQYVG